MTLAHHVADEDDALYPLMFSPLQVGARRLRNRIVHASVSTRYAANMEVTQKLIDYHEGSFPEFNNTHNWSDTWGATTL